MRNLIVMICALALLLAAALLGLTRREAGPQVSPYAQSRIRQAVREGNKPNYNGTPDTPGYGTPNVSPDVARHYGR